MSKMQEALAAASHQSPRPSQPHLARHTVMPPPALPRPFLSASRYTLARAALRMEAWANGVDSKGGTCQGRRGTLPWVTIVSSSNSSLFILLRKGSLTAPVSPTPLSCYVCVCVSNNITDEGLEFRVKLSV